MKTNAPIRVLQVVGAMNRGGTETWLMHILRHLDRREFEFTFLMLTEESSAYDEEILDLGAKIERIGHPRALHQFAPRLLELVKRTNPSIVHSHVHYFSGVTLPIAYAAGAAIRIAHSHSDTRAIDANSKALRRSYVISMKRSIGLSMTHGVSASRQAGECLFGESFVASDRLRLIYCGVDMTAFGTLVDRDRVRFEVGIPPGAKVIGHVGRMDVPKNHDFVVSVVSDVLQQEPSTFLLMVGDGPLRSRIEGRVAELGIGSRTAFLGSRADVPRLMLGAMDVLLLPSLWEGMPLVVMEAQAAGLPAVTSLAVPDEAVVVPKRVTKVSLSAPRSSWRDAILAALRAPRVAATDSAAEMMNSPFDLSRSMGSLLELYRSSARESATASGYPL